MDFVVGYGYLIMVLYCRYDMASAIGAEIGYRGIAVARSQPVGILDTGD
jgi:hypothetical protein